MRSWVERTGWPARSAARAGGRATECAARLRGRLAQIKGRARAAGCILVGLLVFHARAQTGAVQTVTGFRVPDYDERNNLKSVLFGDFARVRPDGIIEITNLKIDFYEEGRVNMTVTSPQCAYNQKDHTARSDAAVRIQRDNLLITGAGFWWSAREERFEIFTQARVEIQGGAAHVTPGGTP